MTKPKLTAEQRKTKVEQLNELIQETERVRTQVGYKPVEKPKDHSTAKWAAGYVGGALVGIGLVYLVHKLVND